ncbi:pro-resilin-like [Penaeus monodon]|uniref:pro-resilin-like n=1 Tax=Penaeus monodon TaxID=6687 RepID=UPI0018A6E0AF|nr:pro-resilin-like [Penaeus monodon]
MSLKVRSPPSTKGYLEFLKESAKSSFLACVVVVALCDKAPVHAPHPPVYAPRPSYHAPAPYHAPEPAYHAPDPPTTPPNPPTTPPTPPTTPPDVTPKYNYNYGVADTYSGANFAASESRDGYNTEGTYTVDLPDGRKQIVNYVDNGDGYVAQVTYEGEAQYPEYKPTYKPASPTPAYA